MDIPGIGPSEFWNLQGDDLGFWESREPGPMATGWQRADGMVDSVPIE